MADLTLKIPTFKETPVRFLEVECGVRYWEDATVNGIEDTDGKLIPCRLGDAWCPWIDLQTGKVENWPKGTTADIHYKVCDNGAYHLRDGDGNIVASIDGYVINMMCPEGEGYGDYVIMKIAADGTITNWKVDLSEFEERTPTNG